jgi:hypothetical protein
MRVQQGAEGAAISYSPHVRVWGREEEAAPVAPGRTSGAPAAPSASVGTHAAVVLSSDPGPSSPCRLLACRGCFARSREPASHLSASIAVALDHQLVCLDRHRLSVAQHCTEGVWVSRPRPVVGCPKILASFPWDLPLGRPFGETGSGVLPCATGRVGFFLRKFAGARPCPLTLTVYGSEAVFSTGCSFDCSSRCDLKSAGTTIRLPSNEGP